MKGFKIKTTIKVEKEVDIRKLVLSVAVRYEEEDMPNDAPGRQGESWLASIDIDEKKILGWPQGRTLEFNMKVCDSGLYILFDENDEEVIKIVNDYVPNNLLPGEYGDYLELKIDENGVITNWLDDANFDDFTKEDDE